MQMEVSQLCDTRNEEIDTKVEAAKRRTVKEKRQKTRGQASKPKENKDRHLTNVVPLKQSAPLLQAPSSPPPEEEEAWKFVGAK